MSPEKDFYVLDNTYAMHWQLNFVLVWFWVDSDNQNLACLLCTLK